MISMMLIIVLLSLSMGSVLSYTTDDYDPTMLRPYLPIFNNSSKRPSQSRSTKKPIDNLFIRRRQRKLSQQEGKKIDTNESKQRRMRRRSKRSAVSLSNDDYDPNLLRPYIPIFNHSTKSPSASSTKSPSESTKKPSQSTKKPIDSNRRTMLEQANKEIHANASKRRNVRRRTRVQVVKKEGASS